MEQCCSTGPRPERRERREAPEAGSAGREAAPVTGARAEKEGFEPSMEAFTPITP